MTPKNGSIDIQQPVDLYRDAGKCVGSCLLSQRSRCDSAAPDGWADGPACAGATGLEWRRLPGSHRSAGMGSAHLARAPRVTIALLSA